MKSNRNQTVFLARSIRYDCDVIILASNIEPSPVPENEEMKDDRPIVTFQCSVPGTSFRFWELDDFMTNYGDETPGQKIVRF